MSTDEPITKPEDLDFYLTPKQVAEKYEVPIGRVYSAIKDGRLSSIKRGWGVLIDGRTLPVKWPGRSSG